MLLAKLSQRERRILYFCLGLMLFAVAYNLLIAPLLNKWLGLNQEIYVNRNRIERNLGILAEREAIQAQYEKFADYIKRSGTNEEEIALLLQRIEAKARECNVHISNIRPQPVQETQFYRKYSVEVQAEVKVEDLAKFIYELENSPFGLRIEKLRLSLKAEGLLSEGYMLIIRIIPL